MVKMLMKSLLFKMLTTFLIAEDVTDKLTFEAINKRAIKIGDMVFFNAEAYFDMYVANYNYTLAVDSSIRPRVNLFMLSAVMVDGGFTPRAVISSYINANGLTWRSNQVAGNYLCVSGWWKIH